MDLKGELLRNRSKQNLELLAGIIGDDPKRFAELMEVFFVGPYRITQWSAQLISKCCDHHPQLILPYLGRMIDLLDKEVHAAVKRNVVRTLQFIDLPDAHWDKTVEYCFRLLQSRTEPIAVKVFAMTVLANLCKKLPELKNELRMVVEDQLPYSSAGFVSRGRKVLSTLK